MNRSELERKMREHCGERSAQSLAASLGEDAVSVVSDGDGWGCGVGDYSTYGTGIGDGFGRGHGKPNGDGRGDGHFAIGGDGVGSGLDISVDGDGWGDGRPF